MNSLSDEQNKIYSYVVSWLRNAIHRYDEKQSGSSALSIAGYAGTGKTFMIPFIREAFPDNYRFAFCTYTGKASSVLRSRLENSKALQAYDYVGTLHSLLYIPIMGVREIDGRLFKVITGWRKKDDFADLDAIIVDEASMVSQTIWTDLMITGVPIVAFGDHGQLPPIDSSFSLMTNPTFTLNNIHRQALGNPIIDLSIKVRQGNPIPYGVHSPGVFKLRWSESKCKEVFDTIDFGPDIVMLCGMNKTRVALNNIARGKYGFTENFPYAGERLICLRNNRDSRIMNGQLGTLLWLMPNCSTPHLFEVSIQMDDFSDIYTGAIYDGCFGQESYADIIEKNTESRSRYYVEEAKKPVDYFDYGYAISVHRSQGSEWPRVVLFEERSSYWDEEFYRRWLYTAVTRSKEKLFIIA